MPVRHFQEKGQNMTNGHCGVALTATFMLAMAAITSAAGVADVLATITVDAGKHARVDTPVWVDLGGMALPQDGIRLVEIKGGQRVSAPSQVEPGKTPRLNWILSGTTPPDTQRVYEVEAGQPAAGAAVELRQDDTGLDIVCGNAKVLRFQHAVMPPPAGADKRYARSGFIHPLWTPSGTVLTNIHAPDHIHHMGLWNPWTSTEFESRKVDFWNLKDGTGTVRFVRFVGKASGPVFADLQAAQEHVDLSAPGGEKVVLNEVLELRAWNAGGPDKGYWLIDLITTQRCASSSPLKLLKYRYGGLGFRATAEWKEANSDYLTSEGKDRKNGHATRARWCNMFGTTGSGSAGLLMMSHPQNREHPEPVRIWPEGDIFFNFCPIQQKEWTLEPGNDYVLKYRLFAYDGKSDPATCQRLWADFGDGPTVKLARK